ncbi:hypothetical protein NQ176_g2580 [Zarea fungicola]|uniref:Uncharacterized protein n=1 Tax=Zarea fungicola TaxID=93591 RepID=A0ACC1NPU4_9HYPO|nr:hypothetical protein NQ176_g2580 [Lecanicillium fungicola]
MSSAPIRDSPMVAYLQISKTPLTMASEVPATNGNGSSAAASFAVKAGLAVLFEDRYGGFDNVDLGLSESSGSHGVGSVE